MIEWTGDIWKGLARNVDAICITTNGVVKADGRLVMGAGMAKQARDRFPGIDAVAGKLVQHHGNHVNVMHLELITSIVAFPTKHNWRDPSPIELVERSAAELVGLANTNGWSRVLLTRPGCGRGGLKWNFVKPRLEFYMDNRFIVVDK